MSRQRTLGLALILLVFVPALHAQRKVAPPEDVPVPLKGSLVIVGGGAMPDSVIQAFVKLAGGAKADLIVIPTASAAADEDTADKAIALWQKRGIGKARVLHTRTRAKANDDDFVKPLTAATAIWLGGGDQNRLIDAYQGTLLEKEMHRLLERGGTIGGTSAGAAVMSKLMIAGGTTSAKLSDGFGFLPNTVVDQHFLKRNRIDRLLDVLHRQPGWFGLGIDEGTAAIVQGQSITIVGNSTALVCQRSTPDRPASVRVLHSGDKADFIELSRAALQRLPKSSAVKEKMP